MAAAAGTSFDNVRACTGNEATRGEGGDLGGVNSFGGASTSIGVEQVEGFLRILGRWEEDGEGVSGLMHLASHAGQFLFDLSHCQQ